MNSQIEMHKVRSRRLQHTESLSLRNSGTTPSQRAGAFCFTNLEALQTPFCWGFMEASWHGNGWSNHWSLVIDLDLLYSPSSPGAGQVFRLNIHHVVGSPGNQLPSLGYLRVFQKSPQYWIRHLNWFHHLENSKCFRGSVPVMKTKNKHIFFYYKPQYHNLPVMASSV